jgi:phosphate transport system permease protein
MTPSVGPVTMKGAAPEVRSTGEVSPIPRATPRMTAVARPGRAVGRTMCHTVDHRDAPFMVTGPTDGVMNSLPLFIFSTVRSGEPIYIERAYGAAAILLAIVLILFVTARLLARPRKGSR